MENKHVIFIKYYLRSGKAEVTARVPMDTNGMRVGLCVCVCVYMPPKFPSIQDVVMCAVEFVWT